MVDQHLGRSWPVIEANIVRCTGSPLPHDFNERRIDATTALFERELTAVAGVVAAVADVHAAGARTCVASSSARGRIELVLSLTGQLETFAGRIHSASDVRNGKPAPDLFLHAASRMGIPPARCVVVEEARPDARRPARRRARGPRRHDGAAGRGDPAESVTSQAWRAGRAWRAR
ncbi:HAD family hydrolase [Pimelobacter simplex]|uniref:HAD family hydrolase n=1 Tax=Nocardioides simplex TaxID=2045 RepID=UPI00366BBBF5